MVVAGGRAGAYSIHNLATYGVSHASGHVKMRYAATTWGWRFKRGGIPWSSTRGDEVVAVKVIEPRQGSPYHLLALRTIAVWEWAVTVYPRHTWYIRMWDDVFPVVERYLDIANSHDGSGKLAVGRVIGKRQAYLSGGPLGSSPRAGRTSYAHATGHPTQMPQHRLHQQQVQWQAAMAAVACHPRGRRLACTCLSPGRGIAWSYPCCEGGA